MLGRGWSSRNVGGLGFGSGTPSLVTADGIEDNRNGDFKRNFF